MFKPPYIDMFGYFQSPLPITLHVSMFRNTIKQLANAEQRAYWMPLIENVDIVGCYAQTELGHGSNVAGIETTATFDSSNDQFIINTPSMTATKYWPGDLGMFASHAIVFARLLIGGNDHGVQPFMVQIRDTETWKVCSGIKAGDLGPKIGYPAKNNGWASFENIRIPRTNLMMGLCEVSREGQFQEIGDRRILYSVMMAARMQIIQSAGNSTLASTQIAVRYCSVRRQFSTVEGSSMERRVIDYQTTKFKLSKLLTRGIVQAIAANWVVGQYHEMIQEVKQKDFSRLDQNHHILSGFKSLFSEQCNRYIDEARRCTGGAGYQSNAGFTNLWQSQSANVTQEGENTVMFAQSTRFLIKLYRRITKEGQKVSFPFLYLNEVTQNLQSTASQASSVDDFLNIDLLERALALRSLNLI